METNKSIIDAIRENLNGETQKNALDFANTLNDIGMPPEGTDGKFYSVNYKNAQGVCHILITGDAERPGPWTIWTDGEFDGAAEYSEADEALKEAAWRHINRCENCGCGDAPGKQKTVLGREFDRLCNSAFAFTDPDAEAVDCAKKLILLRKSVVDRPSA